VYILCALVGILKKQSRQYVYKTTRRHVLGNLTHPIHYDEFFELHNITSSFIAVELL